MSSAYEYMVGSAPSGASYAAPLVGQQLGDTIASLPAAYMQGRQNQRAIALQDAFPNGIPTRPDGTADTSAIMSTMAKIGGGQYIQQLMPFLINSEMGSRAAAGLSSLDAGVNGSQPNTSSSTSPNAAGPGNLAPRPQQPPQQPQQSAQPQVGSQPLNSTGTDNSGSDTIRSIATEMAGGRDALSAIGTTARSLQLNPDAPLSPDQAQRVRGFLGKAVGFGPNAQAATAPTQGDGTTSAQQPSQVAPQVAQDTGRGDDSALGNEAQLRAKMDRLRSFASKARQYAATMGPVNPAIAASAEKQAEAYDNQANQIFEYISKGDQAAYEHQLRNQDLTTEEKNAQRNPSQIAAFERDKKRQELLATSRNKEADGYLKIAEQADQARDGIALAHKLINSPAFISGAGQPFRDAMANIGQSLGVSQSASINQIFDKVRSEGILDQIKSMAGTGPVRVAEMKIIETAMADRHNQAGALRTIMTLRDRTYERFQQIRDVIRQNQGIIDDGVEAKIAQIKSQPLITKQELQHPEILQMPRFDTPQEVAAAGLRHGDHFVTSDGRIKTVP